MERPDLPTSPLGRTGLMLTRVGLGTWAIGGPWERGWGAQDDADSVAAIRAAIESGVNWIDTAAVYGHGHAESVIGSVLADYSEAERPWVFTKCGRVGTPHGVRSVGDPASIAAGAESSLRRLGTDRLDVMQLHWPPADGTPLEDAWAAVARLKDEGKTRFIGACNMTAEQLTVLEAVAHVDVVQPPLSLISRAALDHVLPWAAAAGTGAIVYSSMQSGLLTDGFSRRRVDAMAGDDWRKTDPEFTEPRLTRNLALLHGLKRIAGQAGCTVAELAIAWTLLQPGVTAAIVGARRASQVDGWVAAGAVSLDDSARSAIDGLVSDLAAA